MTNLEKLRDEKAKTQAKLDKVIKEQERIEHKLRKEENRAEYLKQGDRAKRTHRLCVKGAVVESLVPGLTDFSEKEFHDLMEQIFSMPQVQCIVLDKMQFRNREENENG